MSPKNLGHWRTMVANEILKTCLKKEPEERLIEFEAILGFWPGLSFQTWNGDY